MKKNLDAFFHEDFLGSLPQESLLHMADLVRECIGLRTMRHAITFEGVPFTCTTHWDVEDNDVYAPEYDLSEDPFSHEESIIFEFINVHQDALNEFNTRFNEFITKRLDALREQGKDVPEFRYVHSRFMAMITTRA